MNSGYSDWAQQHTRRRTPEELSTAFRDLEQKKRVAGWKRNVFFLAVVLAFSVGLMVTWSR